MAVMNDEKPCANKLHMVGAKLNQGEKWHSNNQYFVWWPLTALNSCKWCNILVLNSWKSQKPIRTQANVITVHILWKLHAAVAMFFSLK